MNKYTVIGIHEGGEENRFAESYALCEHPALLIAGVVEGDCRL